MLYQFLISWTKKSLMTKVASAHTITEVTKVPSGIKTFKWAEAQDKGFHGVKKIITQGALLKFPDIN
jgi:hypothetical protein